MGVGYKILLVNNDEVILSYLREKLTINGGYSVSCESNSLAGIETFRRDGSNIVIVKFSMPDMDGSSLLTSLTAIDPA